MEQSKLNWITSYIWGIADDVLRNLYVRGKYHADILAVDNETEGLLGEIVGRGN